MNEPRKVACLDVRRAYARHLSKIFDMLPRDAMLIRAFEIDYRNGQRFFFESQFFKPVPFGEDVGEIRVILERVELPNGHIDSVVKDIEWPIAVEYPALKKA